MRLTRSEWKDIGYKAGWLGNACYSGVSREVCVSSDERLQELSSLDTRSKDNMSKANKIILEMLGIKVGDVLQATPDNGLRGSRDKNYTVLRIHPDGFVDLLARESSREISRSPLFEGTRWNRPRWAKVDGGKL